MVACTSAELTAMGAPVSLRSLAYCLVSARPTSHYEVIRAESPNGSSASAKGHALVRAVTVPLRIHVGAPAVDGDDDPALAQYRHGMPHRSVGDAVFFGEAPLAGEFRRDLTFCDPPLHIVRYLHIGIFRPKGIDRTSAHMGTLECSVSCDNVS